MTSFVKLGFPQSALQLELPTPISNNNARNSGVTLPTPTQLPKLKANYETCQKTETQALVDLLHNCAEKRILREAKAIHGHVLKSTFGDENMLILLNHVAHAYSKCSDLESASTVFEKMSHRNGFSWTVMIVVSNEHGVFENGFKYFCEMQDSGYWPDGFAYSAVIQSCIGLGCVDLGEMVHSQIVIGGFSSHTFVVTSLLNMYAKLGKVEDSIRVFHNMAEHNEVSWNAIISGLTANGRHLEALDYFFTMRKEGFTPNIFTLVSVLKAVGKLSDAGRATVVHKYVSELGLESNVRVGTALIDMYSRCGALCEARSVLDRNFSDLELNMPWNAMISGYSQCNCSRDALELYVQMCQNGLRSDLYTFCSVFSAIADLKYLNFAKEVHGMVLKSGDSLNVLNVNNAIADAYSKCGVLEDVRKVCETMEERDIVSWTTLLTAYSQGSEWDEALHVFSQMREAGLTPNHFTFSTIFVSCAGLCFLEYGRQVHGLLCKAGLDIDKCTESALINMYAKCGSIIEVEKVFQNISNPDIVSWTAIISGYAQHGFVGNALRLFERMEQSGIKPNGVTLLCVLFACSHGGMVEEGLHYFHSMEECYGVVPEMEHYACIVDLLGRVGRLNDALDFIEKMPIEQTEMVWQSLLAACRVHGNVELGEIAAEKIISLCPEDSSTYILLSNTYMQRGSFRDGIGLRNAMKERGVKKEPGYSWISLKGRVHKFYAGDQEHPQKDVIYDILEELRDKIKKMGYVPDLRYVLHDGD